MILQFIKLNEFKIYNCSISWIVRSNEVYIYIFIETKGGIYYFFLNKKRYIPVKSTKLTHYTLISRGNQWYWSTCPNYELTARPAVYLIKLNELLIIKDESWVILCKNMHKYSTCPRSSNSSFHAHVFFTFAHSETWK